MDLHGRNVLAVQFVFLCRVDIAVNKAVFHRAAVPRYAANVFALAMFLTLRYRKSRSTSSHVRQYPALFPILIFLWAAVVGYSRPYLGKHYPGDILVGLLWGAVVGTGVWILYNKIEKQALAPANYISTQYTKTGFLCSHADIPVCVLVITLIYAIIKACFIQ